MKTQKSNSLEYICFFGAGDIYSNFYKTKIAYDNKEFYCSEQLFMYIKALKYFNNKELADKIVKLGDVYPLEYKKIGRMLPYYEIYGASWEQEKDVVMYNVLKEKFTQNINLMEALLSTGDSVIVEASPYDKYWGVGLSERDYKITNPKNWRGLNRLGDLLMKLRSELRKAI